MRTSLQKISTSFTLVNKFLQEKGIVQLIQRAVTENNTFF